MSSITPSDRSLDEQIAYLAKGNYWCGRVWEAWQVGTMTQDDFSPLEDDEEFAANVKVLVARQVKAALEGLRKHLPAMDTKAWPNEAWRYNGANLGMLQVSFDVNLAIDAAIRVQDTIIKEREGL